MTYETVPYYGRPSLNRYPLFSCDTMMYFSTGRERPNKAKKKWIRPHHPRKHQAGHTIRDGKVQPGKRSRGRGDR